MRTALIIATLAWVVVDLGIAATLRSHAKAGPGLKRRVREARQYEMYSCLLNVGIFGAWIAFGDIHGWALGLSVFYALTQLAGVSATATKLKESV